ncbi:MAG: carbon starvation protein A, partial [Lentisphaerae bacterium]
GYGSMLMEAVLAVIVILCCTAGVGMGRLQRKTEPAKAVTYQLMTNHETGRPLTGTAAWQSLYGGSWKNFKLPQKLGAFIEGGANFLHTLGIPLSFAVGIVAVLIACFAGTTLDSATRIQRYVIQELGSSLRIKPLQNKYVATAVAVFLGLAIAMYPGAKGPGSGGLILWPVFGAINQLLAAFAFLVVMAWLWYQRKPVWFIAIPFAFMVVMPTWALWLKLIAWFRDWQLHGNWQNLLLIFIGVAIQLLLVWLIVETILLRSRLRNDEAQSGEEATQVT